jgi:hypothetical protein
MMVHMNILCNIFGHGFPHKSLGTQYTTCMHCGRNIRQGAANDPRHHGDECACTTCTVRAGIRRRQLLNYADPNGNIS